MRTSFPFSWKRRSMGARFGFGSTYFERSPKMFSDIPPHLHLIRGRCTREAHCNPLTMKTGRSEKMHIMQERRAARRKKTGGPCGGVWQKCEGNAKRRRKGGGRAGGREEEGQEEGQEV